MPQEILNIIFSAIGIVVTGLVSWGVAVLINWLNTKIKDKNLAMFLTKITTIVTDAVKSIYQESVEILKKNGKFDAAAQAEAKQKAKDIITKQLTDEMKDYITSNFGEIDNWLGEKIESILYTLKNNK